MSLIIENTTPQVLTITLDQTLIGDIPPGDKIIKENIGADYFASRDHFIEATNAKGEIVLSRKFTFSDLREIETRIEKGLKYKLVISQLNDLGSGDNVIIDNTTGR